MGSRLLCNALLQMNKNVCALRRIQNSLIIQSSIERNKFAQRVQSLHVKIYDKDAGLEQQREVNRQKDNSLFPNEDIQTSDLKENKPLSQEFSRKIVHKTSGERHEAKSEIKSDPDVFGDAKNTLYADDESLDAGDIAEEEYISRPTRRVKKENMVAYYSIIKEHLRAKRIKEAIAVLEERMLKEDRVKPEKYAYNLLISGCARAGYTRKAFNLFTKMRQRGLEVTAGTYTSLFNACANAPTAADGLSRAQKLREIMLEKGHEPNASNYNVMIKAFGRCGDVQTAFLLADEMMERNLEVDTRTFNFLLQACASDSEHGFRHCLLTWRKMLEKGIKPDYYTFNTVLRCVRDCGFGDLQTMEKVLQQLLSESESIHIEEQTNTQFMLEAKTPEAQQQRSNNFENNESAVTVTSNEPQKNTLQFATEASNLEIPNLLLPKPHFGSLISISEITRPQDRFLLLGGLTGFLNVMKDYRVTPSIETLTTMLEVIPPTNAAEKQLISFIRKIGLKSDIDFFNILIKKRSMRFDYVGAKEVLNMIKTAGLHPDIVTYGVLALGCQTAEESKELLQQMYASNIRMNVQILGAMLRQGCSQRSFPYVIEILQISLEHNIKPNEMFLRHLHNFYNRCARAIDARHPSTKTMSFKNGHAKFCAKLRLWYEEQGIEGLKLEDAIKKISERPYEQYKEESVDGLEPDKSEKLSKKQKLRKYIKKIKLENLKDDEDSILTESSAQRKRLQ